MPPLSITRPTRQGDQIKYVDVTSLYPYIGEYPVGHPIVITHPKGQDITLYFGMLKWTSYRHSNSTTRSYPTVTVASWSCHSVAAASRTKCPNLSWTSLVVVFTHLRKALFVVRGVCPNSRKRLRVGTPSSRSTKSRTSPKSSVGRTFRQLREPMVEDQAGVSTLLLNTSGKENNTACVWTYTT